MTLGATLMKPKPSTQVERIKDCFGLPLPAPVQAELKRLQEQVLFTRAQIREVESTQLTALKRARAGEAVAHSDMLEKVHQLMTLLGVGVHTAWPAVFEAFGWRGFKNRRQVGSFMGVWLGGYLYDRTGSYDIVWYIAIALGVFAALINLPVKETAIVRPGRAVHGGARAA